MKDNLHESTIQVRQLLWQRVRTRDTIITTLLWLLYAYLWLPLISFVAWVAGIDFAYERVVKAGGPEALVLLLLWFLIAFLLVLLLVVIWSGFQYSQHHGKRERRVRAVPLDAAAEREFWGIDAETQLGLKQGQVTTVLLDDAGRMLEVRAGSPPSSA